MLQTYSISSSGIALSTGDAVPFNVNDIDTSCRITHVAGTPTIEIRQKGYYQINFSCSGYNTGEVVEGTDYSGMYAFQLNNKNVPVVNALASESSASSTEVTDVGFSVIIYVPASCRVVNNNASLTVNYLGQEGTLLNANLTVTKLG